ncbi:MAG TPA: DsbA family oxidoreductase [Kofleriaceae bacterium]|nr:DsbA family oxidoreductase [Kofleriaceae bacterium]
MTALRIDVWSDIACPWCYVGKRRLETALAKFPHEVEIVWRSFELDPSAPKLRDNNNYVERLAAKYRLPVPQAQQMIDRMTRVGADEGLDFRFDRVRAGNTFDAHRVLHLARERGKQAALKERFMRGYFSEGLAIGDREALVAPAVEVGLDTMEVHDALDSDRYADDVRRDEKLAAELGISGVPFFVMAGRLGVSGAQAPDVLLGAVERAREDVAGEQAGGEVCGPEGC